ncbi:MAG: porin [Pseudooceanicola sp.]
MKKVLFATTALIATAGMAAAEVKFGGYGRFGILYQEGAAEETRIESRFRLNIDGSTTADNGVTFGARVRMQADDTAGGEQTAAGLNGARFYATAGGLTVAAGNILGAIDSMPNLYHGSVGLSGLGYTNVVSDFGADDYQSTGTGQNGVEVIYEADMFTVHGSYSDSTNVGWERIAAAASATFNGYTLAVGYQDSPAAGDVEFVATVAGDVGPVKASLQYGKDNAGADQFTVGLSADVAAATSVQAYFNHDEASATEESYGVGFVHGLGGGASIRGGVASTNGTTRADLGVFFAF